MEYLLHVSDSNANHMTVLSLDANMAKRMAIDVVFEVLGNEQPDQLVANGNLPEGQVDEFKVLQKLIFDRDSEGLFIREGISFHANNAELNPDKPLIGSFVPAQKEGIEYRRCNLVVGGNVDVGIEKEQPDSLQELARLMFIHQVAIGTHVDVTRELAELSDTIAWAEKEGLIEIDVQKVEYKLTTKGKRVHDSYIEEAQNLIKRYDIFGDVDVDANTGEVHFDTNLGHDLRVAVYELESVDPYRARFLLGLNDGEWNKLEDWPELSTSESWYREIFAPIDQAPSVDDVGRDELERIISRGKAAVRKESQF